MVHPTKFDAIQALCPNAEFTLRGDTLEWLKANGDTEPSDSAITTKLAELKTDYDNKEYQRKRTSTGTTIYALTGEQLAMIYDDIIAGKLDATGSFAIHNKAVKDANPKPS